MRKHEAIIFHVVATCVLLLIVPILIVGGPERLERLWDTFDGLSISSWVTPSNR